MRNKTEADFWSGPPGLKWITFAEEQNSFLRAIADAVIEAAGPAPGDRVLDVGCGSGAATLLAADAVGPEGRVLAADIARPFIDYVTERTAHLPQVGTFLGDAQDAEWPETGFDIALSRFGVMFFSDPAAAFTNIAGALKPGGRIVFAAWGRTEDNPYWQIPRDLIDRRLGPRSRPEPNTPGPMGLADADWTLDQFRAAGLSAEVHTRTLPLLHDEGARGAADLMLKIGPAARALAEVNASEDQIAGFMAEAATLFSRYETDGQARIPATIHFYTATLP